MRASKYGAIPSCSSEFSPGFCCPRCPDRPDREKAEEDKLAKPEVSEELQEIRTMLRNWEERGLNMTGYTLPNILRAFLDYLEHKEREGRDG